MEWVVCAVGDGSGSQWTVQTAAISSACALTAALEPMSPLSSWSCAGAVVVMLGKVASVALYVPVCPGPEPSAPLETP